MNPARFAHRYTGARVMPFALPGQFPPMGHFAPGTCPSCGQPSGQCRCGCRECRTESKELLVQASAAAGKETTRIDAFLSEAVQQPVHEVPEASVGAELARRSVARAFIGGGCCVHISVEYAPVTPTAASMVVVQVADTDGTRLVWAKSEQPGAHYQVKESVVTTKPGATIALFAVNATARARWCEVFSC